MTEAEQKKIFDQWLSQHKGLLFKIVRAYAFTSMDQEDLFQDIAIQMWASIRSFRGESAVTTWLYRISLNTAITWKRKEKRHEYADLSGHEIHLLQENQVPVDERLAWLYEEIRKLDEIDRSLTLLLLDGLSYREMSSILGITESNVGVKINRIKKQLVLQSKKYDHYGI